MSEWKEEMPGVGETCWIWEPVGTNGNEKGGISLVRIERLHTFGDVGISFIGVSGACDPEPGTLYHDGPTAPPPPEGKF